MDVVFYKDLINRRERLEGNINRMIATENKDEFEISFDHALKELINIYTILKNK